MSESECRVACPTCNDLNWVFEFEFYEAWHHLMPWDSLCSTAGAGCSTCAIIQDAVLQLVGRFVGVTSVSGTLRTQPTSDQAGPVVLTVEYEEGSATFERKVEVYTLRDEINCSKIGVARNVSLTPSSNSAFEFVQDMLRTCISKHHHCSSSTANILPSHIIDVGSHDENAPIRLLETQGGRQDDFALSHRWGNSRAFTTTKATLSARKRGVSFKELPKTFQDAVFVTRRLGVRFLWIDSVCIIQDSQSDWKRESAAMANIFGNAMMVISADRSTDDESGFLNNLDPSANGSLKLGREEAYDNNQAIFVRPYRRWHFKTIGHRSLSGSKQDPLADRGWALQERLLARRIIHYTEAEMVWECSSHVNCECRIEEHSFRATDVWSLSLFRRNHSSTSDSGSMPGPYEAQWTPKYNELPLSLELPPCYAGPTSFYCQWDRVVVEITRRKFTYATDLLPALMGVSTIMKQSTGDGYHFGLWYGDFALGLLWMPTKWIGSKRMTGSAPSWSWASLQSPIDYYMRRHISILPSFKVRQISTTTRIVSVTGLLVPLNPQSKHTNGMVIVVQGAEEWKWRRNKKQQIDPGLPGTWPIGRAYPDSDADRYRILQDGELFSLLVANNRHCIEDRDRFHVGYTLNGLLVQKMSNSPCNLFRRVGYFVAREASPWLGTCHPEEISIA
ncbi:heterokaryon incompatibility protein-domain-containing protein [Lophiotrema nucula]|uniref:Heterokaryon incompatibility protein-domain-containing protein n=1 Tax=Lophiotrema nucula TaxID=690887 RepID=A0A6A5Z5Y5_9PLEO|nr:heterokaryon incompatibility protein-domain-containing protein [Lophiotrema nucula]